MQDTMQAMNQVQGNGAGAAWSEAPGMGPDFCEEMPGGNAVPRGMPWNEPPYLGQSSFADPVSGEVEDTASRRNFSGYDLYCAALYAADQYKDPSRAVEGSFDWKAYDRVRVGIRRLAAGDIDDLLLYVRELEARAEHCKEEARAIAGKAKEYEAGAGALRKLLLEAMREKGVARASGIIFQARVSERVRVEAPESQAELELLGEMNPSLVKGKLAADKTAIKKALQAGAELPGCRLVSAPCLACGYEAVMGRG